MLLLLLLLRVLPGSLAVAGRVVATATVFHGQLLGRMKVRRCCAPFIGRGIAARGRIQQHPAAADARMVRCRLGLAARRSSSGARRLR